MPILLHKSTAICAVAFLAFCPLPFAGARAAEQVPFVGCASDGNRGRSRRPRARRRRSTRRGGGEPARLLPSPGFVRRSRPARMELLLCLRLQRLLADGFADRPQRRARRAAQRRGGGRDPLHGGTSGRFDVARYSARLFAKQEQKFIAGVIAEGIEPKQNFPFGPFPADKLAYKTPLLVEFETPGNKDGLGTSDRLQKNAQPILGMATLKATPIGPDFFLVTVRLPANQAGLATVIVAQAE